MKDIPSLIKINLLIIMVLTSSLPPQIEAGEPGSDVIIYALPGEINEFSYYNAETRNSKLWMSTVYTSLFKRNVSNMNQWIKGLAIEMPKVSSNGLILSITSREDLHFSNGHNLTVSDVRFSFDVAINPLFNKYHYQKYAA